MKTSTAIFLVIFVAATGFTSHAPADHDQIHEVKTAIANANATFFSALATGRPEILINQYAEDCWIMAANRPTLCGPDAARDHYQFLADSLGVRGGKFITIDYFGFGGDTITEVGFYQFKNASKAFDDGKYIVVWKKIGGQWKRYRDSFNSNHQH